MKTIGLIGGMSWESTITYYQIINETIKDQLGGFHSAKCLLYSVDFHEIEECLTAGNWERGAGAALRHDDDSWKTCGTLCRRQVNMS